MVGVPVGGEGCEESGGAEVTLLDHALRYASRGLRVLPLVPGEKRPINPGGCTMATTDEQKIRAWWHKYPQAGIGLVPGPDFWVLDVDSKPPTVSESKRRGRELIDGHEALRRIEAHGFLLPVSAMASTPSGGIHYWFATDTPMRPSKYALMKGAIAGLDVRGMDSYVVAPPTVIEAGAYEWILEYPPEPAPGWLVSLVLRRDQEAEPKPAQPLPSGYEDDRGKRRWAEVVLDTAVAKVAACTTGRHDTWWAQSVLVGGILWGVDSEQARTRLETAAQGTVTGRRAEIRRTIDQGMQAGSSRPVYPEERG